MAFKPRFDKIPQDDNLVVGLTTLRLKSSLKPAEPPKVPPEWVQRVIDHPVRQEVQTDGRIMHWAPIAEAGGKYLRVNLMPDGTTVITAYFDRRFRL